MIDDWERTDINWSNQMPYHLADTIDENVGHPAYKAFFGVDDPRVRLFPKMELIKQYMSLTGAAQRQYYRELSDSEQQYLNTIFLGERTL